MGATITLFIAFLQYHWRIGANGRYSGYPIEISRMWSELPKNLTHVDAVYERPDRKIAFFIGKFLKKYITRCLFFLFYKTFANLIIHFIFRQAVVLVRFTIFTAGVSQKLGSAWFTRTSGKIGCCYGLGTQWQNILLQWHYVLEVCTIFY